MHEQIIIARRWKTAATAPLALLAIGLGVWALWQDAFAAHVAGWVAIFFGAAALPLLLAQFVRPSRLSLGPKGLVIDTGLTRKRVPWADIEGFYIWRVSKARFCALRYTDGHAPNSAIGRMMRKRVGVDETMAAPWPLAPEALVNVLNQYRLHFSR